MTARERILVIRLGALGDLVLCFQAFHEIRRAHPDAEIALLTMPAFANFAKSMPWFDKILTDKRAPGWRIDQWIRLITIVRRFNPTRVYDLQGKTRQGFLYMLMGGPFGTEWSGAAPFCSYPRVWPPKPGMHFTDFIAAQLRVAHVPAQDAPDLAWLDAPLDGFSLPEHYVMFIPGCAPEHEFKRWPAKSYAGLALRLREKNIGCIAVGTKLDAPAITALRTEAPHVVSLMGRTTLPQLAALARRSVAVIGNDTGPTHLAVAVSAHVDLMGRRNLSQLAALARRGASIIGNDSGIMHPSAAVCVPVITLMSDRVNPVWSAPRGPMTRWIQGHPLETLGVNEVFVTLMKLAGGA